MRRLRRVFRVEGWCPEDRRAEDGPIPERYPMTPLPGGRHRERTHKNVIDSDGTVILYYRSLTGGTLLAHEYSPAFKIGVPTGTPT
jgi:Circularly permutated YpsA SLOG family